MTAALASNGEVKQLWNGGCRPGADYSTSIVYNEPGRHEFQVVVWDGCGTAGAVVWLIGERDVDPGLGTAQGPALPTIKLDPKGTPDHLDDRRYVSVFNLVAEDGDGLITSLSFDWGDGTPVETYPGDSFPCQSVLPNAWPWGSYLVVDIIEPGYGAVAYTGPRRWDHVFPGAGTYTVSVTARSNACDGISQPQDGTVNFVWTVDPPTAP